MATIYRFIVEQKATTSAGRKSSKSDSGISKGSTAKKGKWVSLLNSEKGGVESNRKMRAINPLLNKMTHGYWEKGTRLGRAGLGLVKRNTETGKIALSGVAIAIIISMAIQTILKLQNRDRQIAKELNAQNFKALENGTTAIRSSYEISVNGWNGRQTYNQNK